MLEVKRANRTEVVDDSFVVVDGSGRFTESPKQEKTNPNYGYKVLTREYQQATLTDYPTLIREDFAHAIFEKGGSCPPQFVEKIGLLADYPFKGRGRFLYQVEGVDRAHIVEFDASDPNKSRLKLEYSHGLYICWYCVEGLELIEVCNPKYRDGDLRDLDLTSDEVPSQFKNLCLSFGVK